MTIKELKKILDKFPEDTLVMVSGYEGGFCDASDPNIEEMFLDVHDEWYYGPHDRPDSYEVKKNKDYKKVNVIIL